MPSAMSRPSEPVETDFDLDDLALVAQLHHRALAEGPVDLRQRRLERPLLVRVFASHEPQHRLSHTETSLSHEFLRPPRKPNAAPPDELTVHALFQNAMFFFRSLAVILEDGVRRAGKGMESAMLPAASLPE